MAANKGVGELIFEMAHETMKRVFVEFGGRPKFAQYGLMRLIAETESCKMNDIARCLGITQATLSTAVDGLVRKGLVRRTGDAKDRRVIRLSLTPAGRRDYKAMTAQRKLFLDRMLEALPEADREELGRIIRKLIEGLQEAPDACGRPVSGKHGKR